MDGRKVWLLALGLVVAAGGCQHFFGGLRPGSDGGSPPSSADSEAVKHRPETYVAFGDFRVRSAFAAETPPAQKQQFREEARLAYQQALVLDPNYQPAHLALARLFEASEETGKAVASYRAALQIADRDAGVWYELGMCQARQKDWMGATQSLKQALRLDPDNRQYASTLGFALARAGQLGESFAVLVQLGGEAKAHFNLGRMLQHMQQPQLARQHLEMALLKDPTLVSARTLLDQMNRQGDRGVGASRLKGEVQLTNYAEPAGVEEGTRGAPTPPPVEAASNPPTPTLATPNTAAGAPAKAIRIPPPPVTTGPRVGR